MTGEAPVLGQVGEGPLQHSSRHPSTLEFGASSILDETVYGIREDPEPQAIRQCAKSIVLEKTRAIDGPFGLYLARKNAQCLIIEAEPCRGTKYAPLPTGESRVEKRHESLPDPVSQYFFIAISRIF